MIALYLQIFDKILRQKLETIAKTYSLCLDIVYPFSMVIALRMDTLFPNRGSNLLNSTQDVGDVEKVGDVDNVNDVHLVEKSWHDFGRNPQYLNQITIKTI